jgi:hypothetical protein
MTLAIPFLAILLVFALIFGDDIDRACILFALLIFAPGMSAVPTYSKKGENIDA